MSQELTHGTSTRDQDCDLVARIVAGDEDAVRELYALYGQRLYAYALRLTNDRAMAEDVIQDTLVIAWRSARKYHATGRLIAWLLGIVHHRAMKELRRTGGAVAALDETLSAPGPSPEDRAQARETRQWIRNGLQDLSPEHRAVLELVFYQGLSLNEAAEICECPLGTVKSRLSYARKHLRGALIRAGEAGR